MVLGFAVAGCGSKPQTSESPALETLPAVSSTAASTSTNSVTTATMPTTIAVPTSTAETVATQDNTSTPPTEWTSSTTQPPGPAVIAVHPPALPQGSTSAVDPAWRQMMNPPRFPPNIPDGTYWGYSAAGISRTTEWLDQKFDTPRLLVSFVLTSASVAPSCPAQPVPEDNCTVVVNAQIQAIYPAFLDVLQRITVINGNDPSQAFQVTPEMFAKLVETGAGDGRLPQGLPPGYSYPKNPYLLTIRGGVLVEVDELNLDPSMIVYHCDDPNASLPWCQPPT